MTRSRNNRSRRNPTSSAEHPLAPTDQNRPQSNHTQSDDHNSATKDHRRGRDKIINSSGGKSLDSRDGTTKEFTPYMAARARELKEEGNRRFQRKDYQGAMEEYDLALKLTPFDHPERAVFHSNRAACLMHLDPPQYDLAIHECDFALQAHPGFVRALLRRSRALEALGKLDFALHDVEELLRSDPNHPDALDTAKRIRASIITKQKRKAEENGYGGGDEARHDARGRYSTSIGVDSSMKQVTRSRDSSRVGGRSNDAKIRVSEQSDDAKSRDSEQSIHAKKRGLERSTNAKSIVSEQSHDAQNRGSELSNDVKLRVSERPDDAKLMGSRQANYAQNRIADESNNAKFGDFKQISEAEVRAPDQSNDAKTEVVEQSNHFEMRSSKNGVSQRTNAQFIEIFDGAMESPVGSSMASSRALFGEEENGALFTPCASSRDIQTPHQDIATSVQESLSFSYSSSSSSSSPSSSSVIKVESSKGELLEKVIQQEKTETLNEATSYPTVRPLKLIYDHDIRLSEMLPNSTFGELRKIVKERFPSAKSILIKYKDVEGDLVTITSTKELRLAELASTFSKSLQMVGCDSTAPTTTLASLQLNSHVLDQLRLHVVEVPADQEPHDKEEMSLIDVQSSVDKKEEVKEVKEDENKGEAKEKKGQNGNKEFDQWLLDFAHLFRNHLGIDPNGHVDLHDRGVELVAEALEELVTGEKEAHKLFTIAMDKFKDLVALGFVNWGNVYMCLARKQLPNSHGDDDTKGENMDFCARLKASFDWAQSQYELAKEKFEQSLHVKPDSIDALLGLGQKEFESAKLHWSLAVASPGDLRTWDSSTMLELFYSAEKRMERAAEILAKQEEQSKDGKTSQTMVKDIQDTGDCDHDGVNHEHDVAIKSQIYLFWGNILYEHSQVEFRLQVPSWKQLLNDAVHRFEVAGASPSDIATALETHLSNSSGFLDAEIQDHETIMETNVAVDNSFHRDNMDTQGQSEAVNEESPTVEVAACIEKTCTKAAVYSEEMDTEVAVSSEQEICTVLDNQDAQEVIPSCDDNSTALISLDADMVDTDEAKHYPVLENQEKHEQLKQVDGNEPSAIGNLPGDRLNE